MKNIQILRVSPQEAALYSIQNDSFSMLSSLSPMDSTPIISPSVSYNIRTTPSPVKIVTSDLRDHIQPEEFYASDTKEMSESALPVGKKDNEKDNDNEKDKDNETDMKEVKETKKEEEVKNRVSSFFSQVVLPGSIGGVAGTAAGMFLLPGVGLVGCAIIGGLGLTTLANLGKALWIRHQADPVRLTVESKPLDL